MASPDNQNGITRFQDPDRESGHILALWMERSGVKASTILDEMSFLEEGDDRVGRKTFQQWTSDTISSKLISGPTPEIRGARVVALVRWFIREHQHRSQPVVGVGELQRFISLYPDIPVKNRLQLRRIQHEFELDSGLRDPHSLFNAGDWREQYADWPVFGMVVDELWCLRATNVCDLELVGLHESDTQYWEWWHRLAVRVGGTTKFASGSPFQPLRGAYAEIYHRYQLVRFRRIAESPAMVEKPRCQALLALLRSLPGFNQLWEQCEHEAEDLPNRAVGVPIPFFRPDGTLLWMYEVSVAIPSTDNYRLIVWSPVDENTSEYLAEIRRQANQSGKYSRRTFFIEDYAGYFTEAERFALGV